MTVAASSPGDLRIVYRAGGTGLGFLGFFSSLRWRSRLPMVIPPGWIRFPDQAANFIDAHCSWAVSWGWHPKILANLSCQMVAYFVVARNGAARVPCGVMPPGMISAFPEKRATMGGQVSQQIATLHTAILNSS